MDVDYFQILLINVTFSMWLKADMVHANKISKKMNIIGTGA